MGSEDFWIQSQPTTSETTLAEKKDHGSATTWNLASSKERIDMLTPHQQKLSYDDHKLRELIDNNTPDTMGHHTVFQPQN